MNEAERSADSRFSRRRLPAAGLVAALLTLLLVSSAAADGRIGEPGSAAGQIASSSGVAVSEAEAGDVYVADSQNQRIDQFEPDGTFLRAFGWGVRNLALGSGELQVGSTLITNLKTASGAFAVGQVLREVNEGQNAGLPPTGALITAVGPGDTLTVSLPASSTGPRNFTASAPELQECTTATGCQPGIEGSGPGQLLSSDEIAVDNSCAQHEPPLTSSTAPTCEEFDPSYGDLYLVDQQNFRVEKFDPEGHFLLMLGGEVDKTTHADLCTAADLTAGDTCGAGLPGTGPSHFYKSETDPARSWSRPGFNSIAVGPNGTVYVGDYDRIQEFNEDGTFAGEFALEDGEPTFVSALALDSSGDLYERSAAFFNGALHQIPGVREWGTESPRQLIRTFDAGPEEAGSEPLHVALDSSGDLFVADANGSEAEPPTGELHFRAFKPGGALYAEFGSDQVTNRLGSSGNDLPDTAHAAGIAVGDAASKLYATSQNPEGAHVAAHPLPLPGPPAVGAEHLTDLEPTTATLHAIVNPEQHDTTYQFQYITEKQFHEDGDSFGSGTESTPAAPADLGSVSREDPVQAAISPLTPAAAYRWRVVATSSAGSAEPEASFETLPPVSVQGLATQTVGPELVTLKAELDNNNSLAPGHWTIRLCSDSSCLAPIGEKEGTLPAGSHEFVPREATFTGLRPNTTYHYQLTAHNSYPGELKTADAEFTTEPSAAEERAAEDCPENGTVHGALGGSTLREENHSAPLPDCRAYEQITPANKNGYRISPATLLSPSGERDAFSSQGSFAGAPATRGLETEYLAHRTDAGWLTQPTLAFLEGSDSQSAFVSFNAELDSWLLLLLPAPAVQPSVGATVATPYQVSADGSYRGLSPPISTREGQPVQNSLIRPIAVSADFSRLYFPTGNRFLESDPLSERGATEQDRLYELSGAGGPSPALGLLAENPAQLPDVSSHFSCEIDKSYELGPRWASADGSIAFYTAPVLRFDGAPCETAGQTESGPNKVELFVAHQGASVQLSTPFACSSPHPCSTAPPAPAALVGASPDGRLVWFTTRQPLVDSDADPAEGPSARDLYLARLTESGGLESLTQASAGEPSDLHPGEAAGLQGMTQISPDGNHAAFVATTVLTTEPNSKGAAQGETAAQGADNLYLYDAESGQTRFVARLCSGREQSGSIPDPTCPLAESQFDGFPGDKNLWSSTSPEAQFTPSGHYLLFASVGRLAPGDTDSAADAYRYDFATGRLVRLSVGRDGNDANGNDDAYPVELNGRVAGHSQADYAQDATRVISTDGSLVVFATAASLASSDTNTGTNPGCGTGAVANPKTNFVEPDTGCDVYEWEEAGHGTCAQAEGGSGGCVRLLSDGHESHGSFFPKISASGRDIVFSTQQGLVPADTDGVTDIYDAREGGGFPYVPPREPPCAQGSPEPCHGPIPPEPPPPNISTPNFVGPGNEPTQLKCAKGKHKVNKHGQIRCVPNKPHKKHHHKAKHKRAASANRGGGK